MNKHDEWIASTAVKFSVLAERCMWQEKVESTLEELDNYRDMCNGLYLRTCVEKCKEIVMRNLGEGKITNEAEV